jgi:hypothetical protein
MRRSEAEFRVAFFERARVLFVAGQAHLAEPTYEAFLEGLRGAIAYLPLPERVPFANLFLLPSRDEFDRFVGHITSTPTHASRVGQSRGQDIYLLSPAAYTTDAAPNWRGPDGQADLGMFRRLVAHETVHLVEEALSPREAMEVRPGWWSEGLAVRISNQHRLDADVRDHMRADLEAGGRLPSRAFAAARLHLGLGGRRVSPPFGRTRAPGRAGHGHRGRRRPRGPRRRSGDVRTGLAEPGRRGGDENRLLRPDSAWIPFGATGPHDYPVGLTSDSPEEDHEGCSEDPRRGPRDDDERVRERAPPVRAGGERPRPHAEPGRDDQGSPEDHRAEASGADGRRVHRGLPGLPRPALGRPRAGPRAASGSTRT